MPIVRKTILFVLIPIFAVMLTVAVWFHVFGLAQATASAEAKLSSAGELVAQLIEQRVREIDQALDFILVEGHLEEFHMYSQVELLDEAEDARLSLEQALERLARTNHYVARIECYDVRGERFIAVVDGERVLTPQNESEAEWFAAALTRGRETSFDSRGMMRLAEARQPDYSNRPIAVVSIVFDFAEAASDSTRFATRYLEEVHVSIVGAHEISQFHFGPSLAEEKSISKIAPLPRFNATLLIQQTNAAAYQEFYQARAVFYSALTLVTVGLLLVAALGTHMLVKDLRNANRVIEQGRDKLEQAHHQLQLSTDELAAANTALEKSNEEFQQYAYIASHDLQEPLRAIRSFTQLLQRHVHGKLDSKGDEYLDWIFRGTEKMQQLVNDLLAFSRVDSQAKPFTPTDLNDVFESAREQLVVAIEDRGGDVSCDELPTVEGDPSQLLQLMQNLISNGLKYQSGRVPKIHVFAERNEGEWTIAVRDNGIGIAPEHHDKIFEIFRRLHSETEYPGTGIGLAVCRRIAERHGGRIWVESQVGHGSTFYFTVPHSEAQAG